MAYFWSPIYVDVNEKSEAVSFTNSPAVEEDEEAAIMDLVLNMLALEVNTGHRKPRNSSVHSDSSSGLSPTPQKSFLGANLPYHWQQGMGRVESQIDANVFTRPSGIASDIWPNERKAPQLGSTDRSHWVCSKWSRRPPTALECCFCRKNGKSKAFYKSHIFKDPVGKVLCPVLRKYSCPVCNNSGGDKAHTIKYCPLNRHLFGK